MATYANESVALLAGQLKAGLLRLRKGYVDSAEELLRLVEPANQYPYDFVVFRLTGYRLRRDEVIGEPIPGHLLRADLTRLMLDLCDSFVLRAADYPQRAYTLGEIARRLRISTKTLGRWRRDGLPVRRLVFSDGTRRLAVLAGSIRWFVARRRRQVAKARRFSSMASRRLSWTRPMAACTLSRLYL